MIARTCASFRLRSIAARQLFLIQSVVRQLYELFIGIVQHGQERGELCTTVLAESMALILMATYFYSFFAWLELDHPPALAVMLRAHLDLLLQGMRSLALEDSEEKP